jgi:3-dehydroquinate dehydratase/shikimate dehydrogenase
MIIVSVTGPTMQDASRQIRESRRWADIFELRLDLIRGLELVPLLRSTAKPRIATARPIWEGGEYAGDEESRLAILDDCVSRGVEFVDLELKAGREVVERMRKKSRTVRLIVSHHESGVPRPAAEAFRMFAGCGGDIVKWAYPAQDSPDLRFAYDFLRLARRSSQKAIAVATGEAGEASRVLHRVFGGWGTYAAAETGPGAAPGQLPASSMVKTYRVNALNSRTRVFGLLGNPVAQSNGIFLHNASFRRQRANAVYVRFLTSDLERFMKDVLPLTGGCSVTIPFKEKVASLVRGRDREVRATGAANTLYRRGNSLRAANGDAAAALDALEGKGRVKGKVMLIIGAGGAARAIAYEALQRRAQVFVANRTEERAAALAREFGIQAIPFSGIGEVHYDILVNATPVGMFPGVDETPVPRLAHRPGTLVFDAVSNPRMTRLLKEAKEAGARVVSGEEMFVRQAARQQELFLGTKGNLGLLRTTMRRFH